MTSEAFRFYALLGGVFLTVLSIVLLVGGGAGQRSRPRAVAQRLREIAESVRQPDAIVIDHETDPELPEALQRLVGASTSRALSLLLIRAGSSKPPVAILVGIAALFAMGASLAWLAGQVLLVVPVGLIAALLPVSMLQRKAQARCKRFGTQYAEVLDFLARSMRTGHDLTASLRMVGDEFPDPIGPEFRKTVEELRFGVPIEDSLARMAERVACDDLGYLIACIAIQRETGGSLANALATLARTIRERHIFDGKVRVLSAQGRLSAIILCLLPLLVLGFMYFSNRAYVSVFWTTDAGKQMAVLAGALLLLGSFWVMRTVKVRV